MEPLEPPAPAADVLRVPPQRGSPAAAATRRVPGVADAAVAADRRLLERMQGGDERALGELYDRWSPSVRALAAWLLRDGDEAEEVVEDTFWQAWRRCADYDVTRGSAQAWLLTIARSRALDRRRSLGRRREERLPLVLPATWEVERDGASEPDPMQQVEHAEERALVLAALQELPREQRESVALAYFEGLSQSEIAERMQQPLGTVKTRVRLAMQKLRERLLPLREPG